MKGFEACWRLNLEFLLERLQARGRQEKTGCGYSERKSGAASVNKPIFLKIHPSSSNASICLDLGCN